MTDIVSAGPHISSDDLSQFSSADRSKLSSILAKVAAMIAAGGFGEALEQLLSEPNLVGAAPVACATLAFLLLRADRPREALVWLNTVLFHKPDDVQALMGSGRAHEAVGAHEEALRCYEKAVALEPKDAEAWYRHGHVLSDLGRHGQALASLEQAMVLDPNHAAAAAKRRDVLEAVGDLHGAIAAAIACCRISLKQSHPLRRLADLLQRVGSLDQAINTYDMALRFAPADFHCIYNKALALKQAKRMAEALVHGQAALRLKPDDRETLMLLGGVELALGNRAAADACFIAVAQQGGARCFPAVPQPARFRAALLFSPVSGNTPYEDLIEDSGFDATLFIVLPNYRYDPRIIDAEADVVVNLVSEADLGTDVILSVGELVDLLARPVINHPSHILGTDRQSIARRLVDIPDTVMPATLRLSAADLRLRLAKDEVSFPAIIRHAGTHGGDRMEKVENAAELLSFAEEAGKHPLYLTDYLDYSSPDGLFRKYRFIYVGEEILPYHLAIGDQWKVHHASTRMGEVEWMRDEEATFLEEPARVFGPQAMAALDVIRREIGLDYFGIDCSLDADGKVVVFEVNASMLIHLHNEGFEYKTPHVHKIRAAFEQLLERRAGKIGEQTC